MDTQEPALNNTSGWEHSSVQNANWKRLRIRMLREVHYMIPTRDVQVAPALKVKMIPTNGEKYVRRISWRPRTRAWSLAHYYATRNFFNKKFVKGSERVYDLCSAEALLGQKRIVMLACAFLHRSFKNSRRWLPETVYVCPWLPPQQSVNNLSSRMTTCQHWLEKLRLSAQPRIR